MECRFYHLAVLILALSLSRNRQGSYTPRFLLSESVSRLQNSGKFCRGSSTLSCDFHTRWSDATKASYINFNYLHLLQMTWGYVFRGFISLKSFRFTFLSRNPIFSRRCFFFFISSSLASSSDFSTSPSVMVSLWALTLGNTTFFSLKTTL